MKKPCNDYYVLRVDNYGQPDGSIEKVNLTPKQYKEMKKQGVYVYNDYLQALLRVQD